MPSKPKAKKLYVVAASDSSWPCVLGVHTSQRKAMAHFESIRDDRLRWYRVEWDHRYPDTQYTREHDPLFRQREARLRWWQSTQTIRGAFQPEEITLIVLRVWA